jgi:hypothetical protein
MASQSELESQIAIYTATIADLEAQYQELAAVQDYAGADQIQSQINTVKANLAQSQADLEAIVFAESYNTNTTVPTSPTEQDVINASQDAGLSQQEQNALAAQQAANRALLQSQESTGGFVQGLTTALLNTRSQATQQDQANARQKNDWRVRLQLAPSATYLYKVAKGQAGILNPLQDTDGVIFPYTPSVSVNYAAGYEPADIAHSNYKIYSYKSSSVDSISIGCEFTAQDTYEANYMLAVIHFFRSVTKMFYGQDQNPKPGTPPPLCYLTGLGAFQFDNHPLAVTAFNYSLPNDVDYIRAGNPTAPSGVNLSPFNSPDNSGSVILKRLQNLVRGGGSAPVQFSTNTAGNYGTAEPTYVPTKMQISISAVPIITRNDISNNFSLREYATGKLLRGSIRQGGGIW